MSTATDGRRREHKVRDALIADGYTFLMRSAASKGSADLLLAKPGQILWVQVGSGSKYLSPAARSRFVADADLLGATPILAIVWPRKPITYYRVGLARFWPWTPDEVAGYGDAVDEEMAR